MPDKEVKNYEYQLPEGYIMAPELREKLDNLVAEAVMSNEMAQKFVDLHVALTEDYAKRLEEASAQKPAEYAPENPNL